jgi:hypothetical protein
MDSGQHQLALMVSVGSKRILYCSSYAIGAGHVHWLRVAIPKNIGTISCGSAASDRRLLKPRCFHGSRVRHPNVGRLDSGKLGDITFAEVTIWAQARDAQYRNASKFAGIRK